MILPIPLTPLVVVICITFWLMSAAAIGKGEPSSGWWDYDLLTPLLQIFNFLFWLIVMLILLLVLKGVV